MIKRHKKITLFDFQSKKLWLYVGMAFLFVVLIIAVASGDGRSSFYDAPEVKTVEKRGALLVGVRDDVLGFSKDGTGIEIELAKALADKILPNSDKTNIELVPICSSMVDTHLKDGSIDIAVMLLSDDQNTGKYAYSTPYYSDICTFATAKGNSTMSLNRARVGVIKDSPCETRLDSYIRTKSSEIKKYTYPTYDLMFTALSLKDINAIVISGTYFKLYQSEHLLYMHSVKLEDINYAFCTLSEQSAYTEIASEMLTEMKKNKQLDALIGQYLSYYKQ